MSAATQATLDAQGVQPVSLPRAKKEEDGGGGELFGDEDERKQETVPLSP